MDSLTQKTYDSRAAEFAQRYEGADIAELHALLRRYIRKGMRVLEIGCGSGRDAAFMHNLGAKVTAVDASQVMLDQAAQLHPNLVGQLEPRSFPLPPDHPLLSRKFGAVTCLALLMHIPEDELFDLAFQLRQLLETNGLLILSFSTCRTGLSDERDSTGRLFLERPPGEIQLLFERLGFRLLEQSKSSDGMGREVVWHQLVFKLVDQAGKGPVDQIETIINRDNKFATYKLALLRALCDIAQTEQRQAQWHLDDTVSVPLGLVAEKWLFYYWPLIEPDIYANAIAIPQMRNLEKSAPMAFRAPVTELIMHCSRTGGLDTFFHDFRHEKLDAVTAALADEALNTISNTIVTGPVHYVGGALASKEQFFWKTGGVRRRRQCISSRRTIAALGRIHMQGDVWRELSLLGHWIGEALILRWAELTHELTRQQVPVSKVIDRLMIFPHNEREQQHMRRFYRELSDLQCVWTGQPLQNQFEVDHVIPYVLWHNNDLWNLLPALPKVNNQKRDKLATRQALLNSRDAIINYWECARHSFDHRFDYELSRSLSGGDRLSKNWQNQAFSALTAAVETLAVQRGIPRWEPDAGGWVVPDIPAPAESAEILSFEEIAPEERQHYLPIVGELAAGDAYDGFLTNRLETAQDLNWVKVPAHLQGKKRFVIRVAGESMQPTLNKGDLVVFEYHRRPRKQNQIVIAAIAEFGITSENSGIVEAVKRLCETEETWLFTSDNPEYPEFSVPKAEADYPILGTMVTRL